MKHLRSKGLALLLILILLVQAVAFLTMPAAAYAEAARLINFDAYTVFVGTDRHGGSEDLLSVVGTTESYVEEEYRTSISKTVIGGDLVTNGDVSYGPYTGLQAVNEEFRSVLTWLSDTGSDNFYTTGMNHDKDVTANAANHFLASSGKSGQTVPTRDSGAKELGDWAWLWGIDYYEMTSASIAQEGAAVFTDWIKSLDDHKPIIIMSHVPMHARRGDNHGASVWLKAINQAAETKDIVFLWGHNHTGWNAVDQSVSFVMPGGSITAQDDSGPTTIRFTYALAGYIGRTAKNAWRGSTITIASESIHIDHYSTGGHSETRTITRIDPVKGAALIAEDITVSLGKSDREKIAYSFRIDGKAATPQSVRFGIESDPAHIIKGAVSDDGVITFAGNTGSAKVSITCTYQNGTETKTIQKVITVTVNQYCTVTFLANDERATGKMADQTFKAGIAAALPANAFRLRGHTFTGWNTKADGSGTAYANKQTVTPGGDLTLYAQWEVQSDDFIYAYVGADEVKPGEAYVIVSNGYALVNHGGRVASIAVEEGGDEIVISEFGDDLEENILWTLGSDGSLKNEGVYVYRTSRPGSAELGLNGSTRDRYTNWTYTGDQLTVTGGRRGDTTYYIYYNAGWYTNTSTDRTVRLYRKVIAGYSLINARGAEHTVHSGQDAVFTVRRSHRDEVTYDRFTSVAVDGVTVSSAYYTTAKGSLILTLKASYLDTLSAGTHAVKINFTDGSADTSFTILAAAVPTETPAPTDVPKIPKTGDRSAPVLWIALVLLGLVGACAWRILSGKR